MRFIGVLLIGIILVGCAALQLPERKEDLESKELWLGEWFLFGKDEGYHFKPDGSLDYFYFKADRKFTIENRGYYKVYKGNMCEVHFNRSDRLRFARWRFSDNVLIIRQIADGSRIFHFVRADDS